MIARRAARERARSWRALSQTGSSERVIPGGRRASSEASLKEAFHWLTAGFTLISRAQLTSLPTQHSSSMRAIPSAGVFGNARSFIRPDYRRRRNRRRCLCRGGNVSGFERSTGEGNQIGGGATAAGMGHLVVMDDSQDQFSLTHYSQTLWHEILRRTSHELRIRFLRDDLGCRG